MNKSVLRGGVQVHGEVAKKFNVALTRAKALNVIVGNPHILEGDGCWRQLIEFCVERGTYKGCRCSLTKGTDSGDEENGAESFIAAVSKISLLGGGYEEEEMEEPTDLMGGR